MDTLQSLKIIAFDKNKNETVSSIATSVSSLNNTLAAAIQHQAYALKNPDLIIDESYTDLMLAQIDEIATQFGEVAEKVTDLMAVRTKAITVDELLAKYSTIDLVKYSADLVK